MSQATAPARKVTTRKRRAAEISDYGLIPADYPYPQIVTAVTADKKLFEAGTFSDVKVRCGDRVWDLHKGVLARCDFFKSSLIHSFKESSTSVIELHDDDPDALHIMLEFLYTQTYSLSVTKMPPKARIGEKWPVAKLGERNVKELMSVVIIADKYDIPGLLRAAKYLITSELLFGITVEALPVIINALHDEMACPAMLELRSETVVHAAHFFVNGKALGSEATMKEINLKYPDFGFEVIQCCAEALVWATNRDKAPTTVATGSAKLSIAVEFFYSKIPGML